MLKKMIAVGAALAVLGLSACTVTSTPTADPHVLGTVIDIGTPTSRALPAIPADCAKLIDIVRQAREVGYQMLDTADDTLAAFESFDALGADAETDHMDYLNGRMQSLTAQVGDNGCSIDQAPEPCARAVSVAMDFLDSATAAMDAVSDATGNVDSVFDLDFAGLHAELAAADDQGHSTDAQFNRYAGACA